MEPHTKEHYKQKLTAELKAVETELASIAVPSDETASGWEANIPGLDPTATEPDEKADRYEELEENEGIANALGVRAQSLKRALDKLQDGRFGICEVCQAPIEAERLDANPAARTCQAHLNQE